MFERREAVHLILLILSEAGIPWIREPKHVDDRCEFCGKSPKKLQKWDRRNEILDAVLEPIPPGAK